MQIMIDQPFTERFSFRGIITGNVNNSEQIYKFKSLITTPFETVKKPSHIGNRSDRIMKSSNVEHRGHFGYTIIQVGHLIGYGEQTIKTDKGFDYVSSLLLCKQPFHRVRAQPLAIDACRACF
jgi:hypothetical protein